jgi:hypothetical protein
MQWQRGGKMLLLLMEGMALRSSRTMLVVTMRAMTWTCR